MSVSQTNLYRLSVSSAKTLGVAVCLATLLLFSDAKPACGAIEIDGNVGGISEGYTQEYDVTFDIENGPTGVGGGKLYLADGGDRINVGFVAPLTICDNTYGDNNLASDWGTAHYLMGGGDGLEGSDKWEIKIEDFSGNDKLELKLDYIKYYKDAVSPAPAWDTKIEKFEIGGTDHASLIELGSSLDYNHNVLGLTQFFDDDKDAHIDSPNHAVGDDYDFLSPAENWVPEIMYEFELQDAAFAGTGFDLSANSFRTQLFPVSVFHMSPNKLGDHKVYPKTPTESNPIPEPSTVIIWSILGVLGVAITRRRRRNA